MALSIPQNVTTNLGTTVDFSNTYIRVESISGSKALLQATINHFTEQNGVLFKTDVVYYTPDLTGDNFIKQAYEYLKTLPEFANATDC